jgi:hypothetical protein
MVSLAVGQQRWEGRSSCLFGSVELLTLTERPEMNTMTDETMPLLERLQKRDRGVEA